MAKFEQPIREDLQKLIDQVQDAKKIILQSEDKITALQVTINEIQQSRVRYEAQPKSNHSKDGR